MNNEVEYYIEIEGTVVNISTPQGLLDALDVLHTQTLDNMSDKRSSAFCLKVLASAMDTLRGHFDIEVGEGQ